MPKIKTEQGVLSFAVISESIFWELTLFMVNQSFMNN